MHQRKEAERRIVREEGAEGEYRVAGKSNHCDSWVSQSSLFMFSISFFNFFLKRLDEAAVIPSPRSITAQQSDGTQRTCWVSQNAGEGHIDLDPAS